MGSARLLIALDVQLCVQPDGRLDVRDRRADPMYYFIRATVPHVQSTIALYTELYVKCDQQSAIVVDCRPQLRVYARSRCGRYAGTTKANSSCAATTTGASPSGTSKCRSSLRAT